MKMLKRMSAIKIFTFVSILSGFSIESQAQNISTSDVTYNSTPERLQLQKWINESSEVVLSEGLINEIKAFHKTKGHSESMWLKTVHVLRPAFNTNYSKSEAIKACQALINHVANQKEYFPTYILDNRLTFLQK